MAGEVVKFEHAPPVQRRSFDEIMRMAERVRELESALLAFERADNADASEEYADLMNVANEKRRAALRGEA